MKKILSLILALLLLLQPGAVWVVLAEETTNSSESTSTEGTLVENNNDATVNNTENSTANTGSNEAIGIGGETDPSPTPEASPTPEPSPTASPEASPESTLTPEATPEATPSPTPESGVLAENQETPPGSENLAEADKNQETQIKNENETTVSSDLAIEAVSGENQTAGAGEVQTTTGDVEVLANLANIINENLTGAAFFQFIVNIFEVLNGDINLSDGVNPNSDQNNSSSSQAQNSNTGENSSNQVSSSVNSQLTIINDNLVLVENNLVVEAESGANTAVGSASSIKTGNVKVLLNLFNFLNTNLTGNNWFFSVINVFNNLNGNIILPYEKWFYEGENQNQPPSVSAQNLMTGVDSTNIATASADASTTITNNNTAVINNNLNTMADSGNNLAVGGTAEIESGEAKIENKILNVANTNFAGNNWFFVVVNLLGNWTGNVVNSGYDLMTNSLGFFLFSFGLPAGGVNQTSALNQNTGPSSSNFAFAGNLDLFKVDNNNQAFLTNNLLVRASSGGNKAFGCGGCGGSAAIKTGNVSVRNQLANLVNTNITGDHWYFAMINLFGDWNGDLILARPDLGVWVTDNRNQASPGEALTYTITYQNLGEVEAQDVVLANQIPQRTTFLSSSGGNETGGRITWNLGTLAVGETGSQQVTVKINDGFPAGTTQLTDAAQIGTSMDEPNLVNNSASDPTEVIIFPSVASDNNQSSSTNENKNETSGVIIAAAEEPQGEVLSAQVLPAAGSESQTHFFIFLALALIGFWLRRNARRWATI